jgi:hypothetical protein
MKLTNRHQKEVTTTVHPPKMAIGKYNLHVVLAILGSIVLTIIEHYRIKMLLMVANFTGKM